MEKTYNIQGMNCGHCVTAVKKALQKIGIDKAEVEVGKAIIEDQNKNEKEIINAIEEQGYKVINVE